MFCKHCKRKARRKEGSSNLIIMLFLEKLRHIKGYRKTFLFHVVKGSGQHSKRMCRVGRGSGRGSGLRREKSLGCLPAGRSRNSGKRCCARALGFRDHRLKQSGLGVS